MNPDEAVASIEAMSARDRRAEWHRRTGMIVPPAFGSGLLARALAYQLQSKAFGDLGKADLRRLMAVAKSKRIEPQTGTIKPGTWLSRTWHGEVHQVIVLESGFEYRGQQYSSLSEIARLITGTVWSGPRFFGLYSPRLGKLRVRADGR